MRRMEQRDWTSAARMREAIARGRHEAAAFRAALLEVPPESRDAWVDCVLGLRDLHEDGPELPPGCVPYLPCPVEVLLRIVDQAAVAPSDVFVDIGAGPGRAAALVHLLTGASAIGIEVQPALVRAARELAARLKLERVPCVEGDAAALTRFMVVGSVFFLYCPFSGQRLERVLDDLEPVAHTRPLRICCVNVELPARPWLAPEPAAGEVAIYRSRPRPLESSARAR